MSLDLFKSIYDVGSWETFWWGSRWTLSDKETSEALKQLGSDTDKNNLIGAAVTPAAPVVAPFFAINSGLLTLLKSRIEAANKGKGVIVDFPLNYQRMNFFLRMVIPSTKGPFGLNISNVQSR